MFTDGTVHTSDDAIEWQAAPSAPANSVSVSVGTDGTIWVATATDCYTYDAGQAAWQLAGSNNFAQAPAGSLNNLWSIDPDGQVWRSGNGGATWWQETSFAGPAKQLTALPVLGAGL